MNKVKKYSATDCVKYLFNKLYQYIWFTCRDSYLIYLYIQDQPIVTWENAEETEEEEEEEDKMMEKSTTFLSDNAKKATGLYRSSKVSVYQNGNCRRIDLHSCIFSTLCVLVKIFMLKSNCYY